MAAETVKFYVKDQSDNPILGVLVRVFDITGTTFITQDYTVDVGGEAVAEVTLDGDDPALQYTVRLSKSGVAFDGALGDSSKSPQSIEVYSPATAAPTGKNDFDFVGETFERPVATNLRLCRCSGLFKDITGRPLPNLEMTFINQFAPAIVDGEGVLGSKVELRTDEDGFALIDLYRGAEYSVLVQSLQAAEADETGAIVFPRLVVVPDLSSYNLVLMLFPVVGEIAFSPDPVSMSVGDYLDVTTVVTASDARVLAGTACEDVLYESSDTDVVTVSVEADKLVLYAVGPGTAEISATRKDQTIVSVPPTTIEGQPLSVTVT
jgi:hypothetical protein